MRGKKQLVIVIVLSRGQVKSLKFGIVKYVHLLMKPCVKAACIVQRVAG